MDNIMPIEFMQFRPVERKGSLVGFASFKYDGKFAFSGVAVHRRLKPNGKPLFRLLYPKQIGSEGVEFNPINIEVSNEIDLEVSGYIAANFPHLKDYK